MSARKHTVLLKLLLLGDASVGKTSVFHRYIKQEFSNSYKATIGADFFSKTVEVDDKEVILQIWDTAGQERYHSLGPSFFKGSDACVLVYDVTNQESFDALTVWVEQFQKGVGIVDQSITDSDEFIFVVLGNKSDLEGERQVSTDTAKEYCEKNGFQFFETSAKSGSCVEDAFNYITRKGIAMAEQQSLQLPTEVINLDDADVDDAVATNSGCTC